jgi:hypothetical protein
MNELLLDSDVIIEYLRGKPTMVRQIQSLILSGCRLCYTCISVAEIYAGIRPGEELITARFFGLMTYLPLSIDIGVKAGQYLKQYHKSHGTQTTDALIAATAAVYNLPLYTINRKHFPMPDISLF